MLDLDEIRKSLEARFAELLKEAREIDSELREPLAQDSEEQAVELEDDEVLEGLGKAALSEIRQIRNALVRIEAGTYGTCVACGADIKEKRLKALPHTDKCINCSA